MQLFYASDLDEIQNELVLSKEEGLHLSKVLKKRIGDSILVTNGRGLIAEGKIISDKKEVTVSVEGLKTYPKKPLPHLVVAPTKSIDRMTWLVEKAIELGVASITPLLCDHSERRKLNIEKLQKTAISAMKQSKRAYLPEINPVLTFSDYFSSIKKPIAFGTCDSNVERTAIKDIMEQNNICHFLIGPEGDFSKAEQNMLLSKNCIPFNLGDSILRTETAGIAVCQAWQLLRS